MDNSTGWYTSSHSNAEGNCVEVNRQTEKVGVRDTKDRTLAAFWVGPHAWRTFVTAAAQEAAA